MYYDCSSLTDVILRCAGSSSLLLFISIVCASLLLFVFGFESLSFLFFVDLACTFLAAISLQPFLARAHPGSSLVVTRPLLFVRRLVSLHSSLSLPALVLLTFLSPKVATVALVHSFHLVSIIRSLTLPILLLSFAFLSPNVCPIV